MAERVDIGLVCGGARAAAHVAAIAQVPEARLLGMCGADAGEATRLAKAGKAQAFGTLDAMLECDDLDLVIVASPPKQQTAHAQAALAAGRHAWLDPPSVGSRTAWRRLEAAAAKAGVEVAMAFTARHIPNARALRQTCAEGKLGPLAMARYELRVPRHAAPGALEAELAQAIDLVCWLTDKAAHGVFATTSPHIPNHLSVHLVLDDNAIGTVDVHLAPPGQAKAFPPREHLVVVGTKGTRRAGTSFKRKLRLGSEQPLAGMAEALRQMVRHVRGTAPPPAPPDGAAAVLDAVVAALRSARSGQPVATKLGRKG